MKINPNKYYIAVENRIYSLTEKQYEQFKKIRDNVLNTIVIDIKSDVEYENKWVKSLEYIEKVGKFELELFTMFRY